VPWGLSSSRTEIVERAASEPMLDQVLGLGRGQQRLAQPCGLEHGAS
jgi:hypothetical protein